MTEKESTSRRNFKGKMQRKSCRVTHYLTFDKRVLQATRVPQLCVSFSWITLYIDMVCI